MAKLKSTHKKSILLSEEENYSILCLLESGETSLATAVIQLILSCGPHHNQWQLFGTGVMCFVKNNRKRTYFFRLYDFDNKEKIWENEIYLNIEYLSPESKFQSFEGEDCMVGLNFADDTEANYFLNVVKTKIQLLSQMFDSNKKIRNITNNTKKEYLVESGSTLLEVPQNNAIRAQSLELVVSHKKFSFRKKSSKKSKAKLNKLEIGLPTNFRHVQHIGWSPTTGFDFNVNDPKLHNFFSLAGITENQLQDKDTRKFIFDFIDSHGGIETAIQEAAQPIKSKGSQILRQKTENLSSDSKNLSPIKRVESLPLPPPPPPISPINSSSQESSDASLASPPPPPPPPPPLDLSPPPPPLTSEIRVSNSNELKSTTTSMSKSQQIVGNDRNELLEQIRGGIRLKKTEAIESKSNSLQTSENSGNPLATALSRALQNRFRVNQMTNQSSEESDNCDENHFNEWSD